MTQLSKLEKKLNTLGSENIVLKDKLMNSFISQLKRKNEISNLQLKLEKKLKDAELKLVRAKEELNKSLKWTTFSKILDNITNQEFNNGNNLGYVEKKILLTTLITNMSMLADNLLFINCGRNGHLKTDCPSLKKY